MSGSSQAVTFCLDIAALRHNLLGRNLLGHNLLGHNALVTCGHLGQSAE